MQGTCVLDHFVEGTTAHAVAALVGMNRNMVNRFYLALRQIIVDDMEMAAPLHGEVEVHESYFGSRRKGKRERGAAGKVPVFSLLMRGRRAYAFPIADTKGKGLFRSSSPGWCRTARPHQQLRQLRRELRFDVSPPVYRLQLDFRRGKRPRAPRWRHRELLEPGTAPPEGGGPMAFRANTSTAS